MVGVAADKTALIRDYSVEDSEQNLAGVLQALSRMPHQDVLDFGRLAELLGYDRKLSIARLPGLPARLPRAGSSAAIAELVVEKITHEPAGVGGGPRDPDADLAAIDEVGPARAKTPRGPCAGSRRSIWSTGLDKASTATPPS